MQKPEPPERVKVLIGLTLNRQSFVMATDSGLVAWECDEIGESCEDLGIDWIDSDTGFCLFEGTAGVEAYHVGDGHYEPETVYKGKARPVTLDELPALLAMEPPPGPQDEERDGPSGHE